MWVNENFTLEEWRDEADPTGRFTDLLWELKKELAWRSRTPSVASFVLHLSITFFFSVYIRTKLMSKAKTVQMS